MATKIEAMKIATLNNDEYIVFISGAISIISKIDTTMSVKPTIDEIKAHLKNMKDLAGKTTATFETQDLEKCNQTRISNLRYILNTIKTADDAPEQVDKDAFKILDMAIKPYSKILSVAKRELTSQINALILDLQKSENTLSIEQLRLTKALANLESANSQYEALLEQRSTTKASNKMDNSKVERQTIDTLFKDLVERVKAYNLLNNDKPTNTIINNLNEFISETKQVHSLKVAKKKTGETKTE